MKSAVVVSLRMGSQRQEVRDSEVQEARELEAINRKTGGRVAMEQLVREAEARGAQKASAEYERRITEMVQSRRTQARRQRVKAAQRLILLGSIALGLSLGTLVAVKEGAVSGKAGFVVQMILLNAACFLGGTCINKAASGV